jgi:predicted RNase H-like nuclease
MTGNSADPPQAPLVAIGVDGAPGGWVAASLYANSLHDEDAAGWQSRLQLFPTVRDLAVFRNAAGSNAAVTIDVPIGLLASVDFRPCDIQARELLGQRRNSVFAPPARYMLAVADDYDAICRLVDKERETNPAAKGLSPYAAGITPKVKEVDDWVRAHRESEAWLFECHPELCFQALAKGAVLAPKTSAAGLMGRLRLVRAVFSDAEDQLRAAEWPAKQVGLSDLLDAYGALASAVHCARGHQEVLGDGERDDEELVMRMVL